MVIALAPLAAPAWGVGLLAGATVGRALIGIALLIFGVERRRAARPRADVPGAVWMLLAALAALWAWAAANAYLWGCGCTVELAGLSELLALCALTALVAALEPSVRSLLVLSVLAGAVLEAALALAGVHGLTPGTVNTSSIQGRLAGTFGNPNTLGMALAFAIPAGLAAYPLAPARARLALAAALALVGVALLLTLSRSALLAAAAGGAVVLVLSQAPGSRARRLTALGVVVAAAAAGVAYPVFTHLREHAESPRIDPALRVRDRSGWDSARLGLVATGEATLANPAPGKLEVRTPLAGQGVSRATGRAVAGGRYEATFAARSTAGPVQLRYGLEDGLRGNGPAVRGAMLGRSWRRLSVSWRPNADSPDARLYLWSPAASAGFVVRDVELVARAPGAAAVRTTLDTRLLGAVSDQLESARRAQQARDIASRRSAAGLALDAFATQPLRGVGWGRFVEYSAAHGPFGAMATHDEYLRFLAELGAIGGLLLVLVGLAVARAAWRGPRDELGRAVLGLLATGAVGLAFANALPMPDVTMALALAAGIACARAGGRAVAREAAPGWRAYLGPRRPAWSLRVPRSPRAVARALADAAPPARSLAGPRTLRLSRFAPPLRPLPELAPAGVARLAPPAHELPPVPISERVTRRLAPLRPKLPALRLPPQRPGEDVAPLPYRPALDGLRAVAVLAVIGYHTTAKVPGGFLGVDVFFVLSGYLITSILLREHAARGRIRLAEFWARRARRLLPAVLLLVVVCALEVHRREEVGTWALRQSDLLSALFYFANWHFIATDQSYFATFLGASPVRHTWTLAIEEQFYVVWPMLVFAILRVTRGRRALALALALGAAVSVATMALLYDPRNPSRAYFGTDTRAHALLIGAGLALLVQRGPGVLTGARGRAVARWAWAPVALVVLAAFALASDEGAAYYRGGSAAFALLVALGLFVVEAAPRGRAAAVLSLAPLRWIGKLSYSLYLWHWPVLVWFANRLPEHAHLRRPAELAAMFGLATASFYLLERPVRSGRVPGLWLSRRRLAIVAPVALVAAGAVVVQQTTLDGSTRLTKQLAAVPAPPCPSPSTLGRFSWCERTPGEPGAAVVASIGDSTSQALYPGLREAASKQGWRYVEAAEGGCSILPLRFVGANTRKDIAQADQCAADIPRIVASVKARYRPDVWILSDRWMIAPLVTRDGTEIASTDPRRDEPLERALAAVLERLTAGGARVVLVLTPPPGEPVDCALRTPVPAICGADSYSVRDPATARLRRIVRRAAAGSRGRVALVSVDDVVCPDAGRCPAMLDGSIVRYDSIHYSDAFSRELVPAVLARARRLGVAFARHG
jgi:peptidoglycan/LPS O-acetylase OafA/YrhL/O-antigen ligase